MFVDDRRRSRSGSRPSRPAARAPSRKPVAARRGDEEEPLAQLGHERADPRRRDRGSPSAPRRPRASATTRRRRCRPGSGERDAAPPARAPACRAPRTDRRRAARCLLVLAARGAAAACRGGPARRAGASASCAARSSPSIARCSAIGCQHRRQRRRAACGRGAARATSHASPERLSAGTRPARTSDDLPTPDGPITPMSGRSRMRVTIAAISRERPKKRAASASWNELRPAYGLTSTGELARDVRPAGTARARARATSASGKRSSRSFMRQRSTTSASACGTSGARSRSFGHRLLAGWRS